MRKKNLYYANLADNGKAAQSEHQQDGEDSEGEHMPTGQNRNSRGEFIDDEERDLDEQERENHRNEQLLKRLYNAAQQDIDNFENGQGDYQNSRVPAEQSALGEEDQEQLVRVSEAAAKKLNHDMWLRVKEH